MSAGMIGFPTYAWSHGRNIVPLGVGLGPLLAVGSHTGPAAVLYARACQTIDGPVAICANSGGLRMNSSIQSNLKQYIRRAESSTHLFEGFSTEGR